MSNIVACGGGWDESTPIWDRTFYCMELTGKSHPHMLHIPTPAFDEFNRGTLNTYEKAGCDVDMLLLSMPYTTPEMIRQKIEWADIIDVPGGNIHRLITVWEQTGTDEAIRAFYKRKNTVLTGSSAGGICWFKEGMDNCGPRAAMQFHHQLGLKPYCFCPHFEGESWQVFDTLIKTRGISGIACENGAAMCCLEEGNRIYTDGRDASVPGGHCWFYDAEDGYRKYDLAEHPEILARL